MSTKSRALFIYRNKNEEIPEAFLKKACEAYPTWSGLGFIDGDKVECSRDHEGPASPAGILSICNNDEFKDKDIMFCLGKEEDGTTITEDHDNLQPFSLIDDGAGNDKVIVFVDGEFESLAGNGEPEGRPFLFTKHSLVPYIHNTWRLCGGDVNRFMELVRMPHTSFHPSTEAMLMALAGKDAAIAIMTTASDKPFTYYSNSDRGDEFRWGFVNDLCGWTDEAKLKDNHDSKAGEKTKATLKMGTAITETTKSTTSPVMYCFRVNANIVKNSDIRALYVEYHGKQPMAYQNRPMVSLLPDKYESASKNSKLSLSVVAETHPAKATETYVSSSIRETAEQVADSVAKDKLKKFVDANVLQVMSPEDMAKNELPLPTFWDQTGWKLENFVNSTNKAAIIDELFKSGYKDAIKMLVNDLCYAIFQFTKDLEKATTPEPKKPVAPSAPISKNRFKMSA